MLVKDAVALVTGGASGLGLATALRLQQSGARVVILDRDADQMEAVIKQHGMDGFACDVSCSDSVEAAINNTVALHAAIHIAVNCAGIAPGERIVGREGPQPLEHFSNVIEVNLIGTFNVMRTAAAQMYRQSALNDQGERGVIINTSSVAAYEGQIGQAAYSAAKGGVAAMTLPAAREFAKFGIRVMAIAPGIMHTPMMTAMPDSVQDSLHASVPFPQRMGRPEEFAALIEHVVTNSYLNGEVIRLDGSIRMPIK